MPRDTVVGGVSLRLWLQAGESVVMQYETPMRLFDLLFRRLLCGGSEGKEEVMVIKDLEKLYAWQWADIGMFKDLHYLEQRCLILIFMATSLGVGRIGEEVMGNESSPCRRRRGGEEMTVDVPWNAEQLLKEDSVFVSPSSFNPF